MKLGKKALEALQAEIDGRLMPGADRGRPCGCRRNCMDHKELS